MWQCHWLIYWFSAIVTDHCVFICKGQQFKKNLDYLPLKIKSSQSLETVHFTHTVSCSRLHCSGLPVKFYCNISVLCAEYFVLNSDLHWQPAPLYRVSHELRSLLRESVPYVKIYRYKPKHLCPKLNGYGGNGKRKVWTSWGCTHYTCQLAVIYVRPCVGCHVTECAVSHVS